MPFKDFNFKQAFDESYDIGAESGERPSTRPEIRLGYSRAVLYPLAQTRASGIASVMGWTAPGPTLVVAGAGYGWLAEAFEELGFTRVVGFDTSTYIQSTKNTDESADIDAAIQAVGLDPTQGEGLSKRNQLLGPGGPRAKASRGVLSEDARSNNSRVAIRQALGLSGNQTPDFALTETLLEGLTDVEILDYMTVLANWGPVFVHYVVTTRPGQTPGEFNWKTLTEWKALLPTHTFIEAGTYNIL